MNNAGWNSNPDQAAWSTPTQQPWPVADRLQAPIKQVEPEISPYDAMTQDQILMKWQEMKEDIEKAKEREMEMRKYIVKRAFPEKKEGMNTAELGAGYQLKAAVKYNYTLDPDIEKIEKALDAIEQIGNRGSFLAERLVSWKANFLVTEYRPLCEDDATEEEKKIKAIVDSILTISEAAPSLEIKEPKAKKK